MTIPDRLSKRMQAAIASAIMIAGLSMGIGCQVVGGMAASFEATKQIDVPAAYRGLENQRVAVLIDAPIDIQYEYRQVVPVLTDFIGIRISANVPGTKVLSTRDILAFQNENVYWPTMDYGQIASTLGVDRIVIIDLIEYRLFEPGNSYYWDGQVVADVHVYEAESPDSTHFAYSERVTTQFPDVEAVGRSQATEAQVSAGLQVEFSKRVGWQFYDHQRKNQDLKDDKRRGES